MRRLDSVVSDASLEDCVALLADEHRAVHVFKRLVAAGATRCRHCGVAYEVLIRACVRSAARCSTT